MSCNSNNNLYNKGKISKGNLYQYNKESSLESITDYNLYPVNQANKKCGCIKPTIIHPPYRNMSDDMAHLYNSIYRIPQSSERSYKKNGYVAAYEHFENTVPKAQTVPNVPVVAKLPVGPNVPVGAKLPVVANVQTVPTTPAPYKGNDKGDKPPVVPNVPVVPKAPVDSVLKPTPTPTQKLSPEQMNMKCKLEAKELDRIKQQSIFKLCNRDFPIETSNCMGRCYEDGCVSKCNLEQDCLTKCPNIIDCMNGCTLGKEKLCLENYEKCKQNPKEKPADCDFIYDACRN